MEDIIIYLKGGAVQHVHVPAGCPYVVEIRDYDINRGEVPEETVDQDVDGESYISERWGYE